MEAWLGVTPVGRHGGAGSFLQSTKIGQGLVCEAGGAFSEAEAAGVPEETNQQCVYKPNVSQMINNKHVSTFHTIL